MAEKVLSNKKKLNELELTYHFFVNFVIGFDDGDHR